MKRDKKLFTVILTNYNQEKYIYTALESILTQTYDSIELIIADDGSALFPQEEIEDFIYKHKGNNLKSVQFIIEKNNVGTVKIMNKCLKLVTGEYSYIFAADDMLYDDYVIEHFVSAFDTKQDCSIISSICLLCDHEMGGDRISFPEENTLLQFDKKSAYEQNEVLMFGPVFAPGATAYRTSLFEQKKYFDEKYKLIEDWSWFLRITREGVRVHMENFISLKHRGGGVSEETKLNNSVIKAMLKDTDTIYRTEVFPYMKRFSFEGKREILNRYRAFIRMYGTVYYPIYFNYYFQSFKHVDIFADMLKKKVLQKKKMIFSMFCFLLVILATILFHFLFPDISYVVIAILPIFLYFVLKVIIKMFRRLVK